MRPNSTVPDFFEYSAVAGTYTDSNYCLRFRHLLVYLLNDFFVLFIYRTCYEKYICMLWVTRIDDTETLYVVHRCKACEYFYVTSVTT